MSTFTRKTILCLLLSLHGFSINLHAQHIDIRLLRAINLNRNTNLDQTFKGITNSAVPISIATPLLVYSIGLIKCDSTLKRKGMYITETFFVAAFATTALKYGINRERPFITYPDIEKETSGGSPSFPSGHTSTAFATATALSIAFPKWYVIAPSFLWAGSVGYSRMDLGVHYPSDVLAGAIVGCGSAYLTHQLNGWINRAKDNKRQKKPVRSTTSH
jgi:membrane-associated phospholipid phosphatase